MSSSEDDFSKFMFSFRRLNLDALFSVSERQRITHWIDQARTLLINMLLTEHRSILNIWLNIYDGIYDRLHSSMSIVECLEKLREFSPKYPQPSNELSAILGTIDISVPHPNSLRSPRKRKYCESVLAERVFDFSHDCGVAQILDRIPTILLNPQIFDVNREKKDEDDVIEEPVGIFFIAIVLAHEITHAISLARSIHDPHLSQQKTPQLLVFRSYSGDGEIDGGNLIERLVLNGELHLSKPPPTPPRLFLVVSHVGTQVPIPLCVVKECVETCSTKPINELLNAWQGNFNVVLDGNGLRKMSLSEYQPLLIFPSLATETEEKNHTSSPTVPLLQSMHAR